MGLGIPLPVSICPRSKHGLEEASCSGKKYPLLISCTLLSLQIGGKSVKPALTSQSEGTALEIQSYLNSWWMGLPASNAPTHPSAEVQRFALLACLGLYGHFPKMSLGSFY